MGFRESRSLCTLVTLEYNDPIKFEGKRAVQGPTDDSKVRGTFLSSRLKTRHSSLKGDAKSGGAGWVSLRVDLGVYGVVVTKGQG